MEYDCETLITEKAAWEMLDVARSTLRRLPIPRVKVGRSVRYRPADLRRYVDELAKEQANGKCHD